MKVKIIDGDSVIKITGINTWFGDTDEIGYLELTTEKPEIYADDPEVRYGRIRLSAPLWISVMTLCSVQGDCLPAEAEGDIDA